MQVNLVNSRPNEQNFGTSKRIGGLKTTSRVIKYIGGLYEEAYKINFSNQSKVAAFIKKSMARRFAPIYIPIRRAIKPIRRAIKNFKEPY